MSLNGFSLNSAALNSAALLVLAYATTISPTTASAEGTVLATRIHHASVLADASIVVTLTPKHFQYARSNISAGAYGSATSKCNYVGACLGVANAISSVYCLNVVPGSVTGSMGATGYAIPASLLAGFGGFPLVTGTAAGTVVGTKIQHIAATTTAELVSTGTAKCIRNGRINAVAGCTGYADWKYKASGASTWIFDGHAWPTATAVGSVDETKYKIEIGNGFITTGESSASITSYRIQSARCSAAFGAIGTVASKRTTTDIFNGTCGSVVNASGTRKCFGAFSVSASSIYSQATNKVTRILAGNVAGLGDTSVEVVGIRIAHVNSLNPATLEGSCTGVRMKMAEVNADASVSVTMMLAFSNFTVHAPESRSMVVPSQDRTLVVSYEDRVMRMAA